eukprot:41811-Hanusia_phi.AAC.1
MSPPGLTRRADPVAGDSDPSGQACRSEPFRPGGRRELPKFADRRPRRRTRRARRAAIWRLSSFQ